MSKKSCKKCALFQTTFCNPDKCGAKKKRFVDKNSTKWGHCSECGGHLLVKWSTPYDWHLRICFYTCALCGTSFREFSQREKVTFSRTKCMIPSPEKKASINDI